MDKLRQTILDFSSVNNLDSIEIAKKDRVESEKIKEQCLKYTKKLKTAVSKIIDLPKKEQFSLELINNKPWSAFNTHIAPYQSKIAINTDFSITNMKLKLLMSHEIYAGHHSELSIKDRYLVDYSRGEHGIANNFSPQSFISEGIAECSMLFFNLFDLKEPITNLSFMLNDLGNMVSNNAAFYFGQNGWTKDQIYSYRKKIENGLVEEKDVINAVRFDTDPIYSRYSPWYYQAKQLIMSSFGRAKNKTKFIQDLFNLPLTPNYFKLEKYNE